MNFSPKLQLFYASCITVFEVAITASVADNKASDLETIIQTGGERLLPKGGSDDRFFLIVANDLPFKSSPLYRISGNGNAANSQCA